MKGALASILALIALLTAAPAAAQPRLEWSEDWARVHEASYAVTPIAAFGMLTFDFLYDPEEEAFVAGPVLFDDAVREALVASDEDDRERAATVSDVLLVALMVWPLVDSLLVAGLGDLNSDVMWQLGWVALEAAAADLVAVTAVKLLVHRERPHGDTCTAEDYEGRPERCGARGRTRSFPSAHASGAFSAAGVICMSHANVPLYDSVAGDTLACGVAMLSASIVGVLRVIADRHHATDVLVGMASGLFTGLLLPYLLHFGWDPDGTASMRTDPLTAAPPPVLSFSGSF